MIRFQNFRGRGEAAMHIRVTDYGEANGHP
jgi:hypothetical protein